MFEKLIEGAAGIKLLTQLTRIADALEVIAGTYLTEDEKKAKNENKVELITATDEEVIAEEIAEEQKTVQEVLEKNEGKFLWQEDNLTDKQDLETLG